MGTRPIVKNKEFNKRQIRRIFYRRVGIVMWVSFLFAGIENMLFFAVFDPDYLAMLSSFSIEITRMQGYAFGFFFFWMFTFLTGLFCGVIMALPRAQLAKNIQINKDQTGY